MSGTRAGGIAAYKTNVDRYGKDFYRKIGAQGGKNGRTGGVYNNPELARKIGKLGGRPKGYNKGLSKTTTK